MTTSAKSIALLLFAQAMFFRSGDVACQAAIIVDHKCADIHAVPTNWIVQAKQQLHILYGHRSHGGQITDGMVALQGFMDNNGYPPGLYAWTWDNNVYPLPLDLRNHPFSAAMTIGYPNFTDWEQATRNYLSTNAEINVVIWAWSYEGSWATESNVNTYLSLMDGLRQDHTNITFVYMTAALDGQGVNGNCSLRNNQIRSHCLANGLALYDFADIESFDPNGLTNYMAMRADDECWYDSAGTGARDRNWALDWQTNHILGVDWFDYSAAHTQPLNGNLKTYAAWWLWARLAGWPGLYSFNQWQRDHFTAGELSNPALEISVWGQWADPDEDKMANIFEYALGTAPKLSSGGEPMLRSVGLNSQGRLALSYRRMPQSAGVTFGVQRSQDLISWADLLPASYEASTTPTTNGLEEITVELLDAQPWPSAFYRLNLTAP